MRDYSNLITALRIHEDLFNQRDAVNVATLYRDAADAIEELQAAIPKRGEWIEDAMRIKCSAFGTDFNDEVTCCSDCYRWPWNYCPYCGARMGGVQDATD